ncbi:glycoside hydrolase family 3 C-terminal domain-containing protein, partial [Escherichia coli]
ESDLKDYYAEDRLHRDVARDVARRSLVLLENRNQTLPLKKAGTIALVGPLADAPIDMMGSWAADGKPMHSVTVREGLRRAVEGKAK